MGLGEEVAAQAKQNAKASLQQLVAEVL